MSIEDLIRDLARQVAREEVRAALAIGGALYSTATRETWPPGARSRRAARERIRAVPGHERTGHGRATVWRVGVDLYREHHGRRAPVAPCLPVGALATDAELAEAALAAASLRPTTRKAS